jgi:hypothetical protein
MIFICLGKYKRQIPFDILPIYSSKTLLAPIKDHILWLVIIDGQSVENELHEVRVRAESQDKIRSEIKSLSI